MHILALCKVYSLYFLTNSYFDFRAFSSQLSMNLDIFDYFFDNFSHWVRKNSKKFKKNSKTFGLNSNIFDVNGIPVEDRERPLDIVHLVSQCFELPLGPSGIESNTHAIDLLLQGLLLSH